MKYLCLIYTEESLWQKMPKTESDKMIGEYVEFTDGIRKSGHYVGGNRLHPVHTATAVRVRNARLLSLTSLRRSRRRTNALDSPRDARLGGRANADVRQAAGQPGRPDGQHCHACSGGRTGGAGGAPRGPPCSIRILASSAAEIRLCTVSAGTNRSARIAEA